MIIKPGRGIQLNRAHPLARGLVGCWLFNEGTGDKVFDLSLNSNHGALQNMDPATDWIAGRDGLALDLDGVNDYINLGAINQWGSNKISAVMCFKADAADSMVMMRYSGVGVLDFQPAWVNSFGTGIRLSIVGTTVTIPYSGGEITTIVSTYDGNSGDGNIYRDGIKKGSISTISTINSNTEPWLVGTDADASGGGSLGNWFQGQIYYIYLYNRALTASEVRQLYINPYAMFDSRISPAIFVPIVATGLSIPIAMRYYRNRRTI